MIAKVPAIRSLLIEQEIIEGELRPSSVLFEEFRCALCPEILT
jgi:hypothetical protein